jgi:isocitrate dehydrogenase
LFIQLENLDKKKIKMVIFKENTDDIYLGIEWPKDSPEARELIKYINHRYQVNISSDSGIVIKPMSEFKSKRLIHKAIEYTKEHKLPSVTLVHKGNVMKYTEGAFKDRSYKVARGKFSKETISEEEIIKNMEN